MQAEADTQRLHAVKRAVMKKYESEKREGGHHDDDLDAVQSGWGDTVAETVQTILDCGVDGVPGIGLEGQWQCEKYLLPRICFRGHPFEEETKQSSSDLSVR